MRPAAQAQATIELLDLIAESGYPADRTMAQYFKQRRYIGSKDKKAISEHFYAILRKRLSFEYLLQSVQLTAASRLLMAVYLLAQDQPLPQIFDNQRHNPTRFGQTQLAALDAIDFAILETAPEHIRLNVPAWIEPHLLAALGERYEEEIQALNQRATTDIRVNTLRATLSEVEAELTSNDLAFSSCELSPNGIRFDQRVALFNLSGFKQGHFEVQDEGSQLLALATGVGAGDKVVDFCAGAGGKTLALAAMMENKGSIYACDVHSGRLKQLHKRTGRAGVHNVRSHQLSSEHDKWVKQHARFADCVLVDAPCTGTGTWRRNPDSRWNLDPQDLTELQALQQSILRSAARLVKPGGRLLYATCSLLQQENEQQIDQFLEEFGEDFELCAVGNQRLFEQNAAKFELTASSVRTFPALSGTDGFYVCAMRRAIEPPSEH